MREYIAYHVSWGPLGKRLFEEAARSHPAAGGEGRGSLQACRVAGGVRGSEM